MEKIIATGKTAEQVKIISDTEAAEAKIETLENYLAKTDWYIVRRAEIGEAVPDKVTTARQYARDEISKLRAANSIEKEEPTLEAEK